MKVIESIICAPIILILWLFGFRLKVSKQGVDVGYIRWFKYTKVPNEEREKQNHMHENNEQVERMRREDFRYLMSFSSDVIASGTLAKEYDLKRIAHILDSLMGEHGSMWDMGLHPMDFYMGE